MPRRSKNPLTRLGDCPNMFDIHYHLIFGVDDGPKTIEASLELAEASIAEGVTHIVATPHASHRYPYQLEVNQERLAALRERLADRLTLGLGCDFHLSYDNLTQIEMEPRKFSINGTKYLLVEFPEYLNLGTINEVFFRIMSLGLIPIITHPERNTSLLQSPVPLEEWVHGGCLVQITAASLSGRFGNRSETLARRLLRSNFAHFIASDAHNVHGRPPAMQEAFEVLKKDYGLETAERLCIHNPRSAFFGENMPPQPEASVAIYEKKQQKRGFLRRLFG
jgi:protein-tyrosine phosphatase